MSNRWLCIRLLFNMSHRWLCITSFPKTMIYCTVVHFDWNPTRLPPSKRLPNTPKHPFPIFPPSNSVLYPHQRLPNMDYHLSGVSRPHRDYTYFAEMVVYVYSTVKMWRDTVGAKTKQRSLHILNKKICRIVHCVNIRTFRVTVIIHGDLKFHWVAGLDLWFVVSQGKS